MNDPAYKGAQAGAGHDKAAEVATKKNSPRAGGAGAGENGAGESKDNGEIVQARYADHGSLTMDAFESAFYNMPQKKDRGKRNPVLMVYEDEALWKPMFWLISHHRTQNFIMMCIVLNVITMMCDGYPPPKPPLKFLLFYGNMFFTYVFLVEFICVHLAIGYRSLSTYNNYFVAKFLSKTLFSPM